MKTFIPTIIVSISMVIAYWYGQQSRPEKPIKLNLRLNRGVLYLNGKLIPPDSIDTLQPIKTQPTKREITYYSTEIYR